MNEFQRELMSTYIKTNVSPLIVDFIDGDSIPNSVVLQADCNLEELNGYYDDVQFNPPEWLKKLEETNVLRILVIDKIDSISKEEQKKFIEILKYRQVFTNKIPKETIIIVTAENINERTIDEEIYSLVAHIGG